MAYESKRRRAQTSPTTSMPLPAAGGAKPKTGGDSEIDLVDLFYALLDHVKWILLAAVLGAVIMFAADTFVRKPSYQATSKLYVLNSKESAISLSDLQIGSQLTSDYIEVFKNWPVHEAVLQTLDWDMSYAEIQKKISVSNPTGTRILYITATAGTPAEAKLLADTYANVARSFISEKMDTQQPSVFSEALEPASPSSPQKSRDIVLGFLVGALLASAVIVVLHLMNDNIRSAEDVTGKLGMPLLGMVPMQGQEKKDRGAEPPAGHSGMTSAPRRDPAANAASGARRAELQHITALDYHGEEAFNTICTNLSFAGPNVRCLVVTSNNMSEGKSFVSLQLANNMARRGRKVLLIDADIRRSFMMKTTGFTTSGRAWGLAHYLAGHCSLQDVIYETNPNGVMMIPSGTTVADPINLLDSEVFSRLMDQLSEAFDCVIVDAPPVGMVIDAAVIAKSCDGTIFVTEYNKTSRKEILVSKSQMEQSQTRIIGCILNKVTFDGMASKRYYYKGYYKHYAKEYYTKDVQE